MAAVVEEPESLSAQPPDSNMGAETEAKAEKSFPGFHMDRRFVVSHISPNYNRHFHGSFGKICHA
ncbi:MAG: hypothetical protein LBP92_07760 [Deltaproteobacteria bacterium]|jgi:hypothetical protein|nr:hypothetical protein [Deltaproteobacteria bacterium]